MFTEPFSAIGVGSVELLHRAPPVSLAMDVASAVGRDEILELLEVQGVTGRCQKLDTEHLSHQGKHLPVVRT